MGEQKLYLVMGHNDESYPIGIYKSINTAKAVAVKGDNPKQEKQSTSIRYLYVNKTEQSTFLNLLFSYQNGKEIKY